MKEYVMSRGAWTFRLVLDEPRRFYGCPYLSEPAVLLSLIANVRRLWL